MSNPLQNKKRWLQRNICKYANHFWSCSTEAARFLFGDSFCKSHNIELIKNAVDYNKFKFSKVVSALITLLLLIKPKKIVWPLIIGILLFLVTFSFSGFSNVLISGVLSKTGQDYYLHYFESEYVSSGYLGVSLDFIRGLFFLLIAYLSCKQNTDNRESTLATMNVFYLLIFCSLSYSLNLLTRVSVYFLLINIIEIPNCLTTIKNNRNVLTVLLSVVCISYFMVVLIFRPGWNHLYPYQFWW